MLYKIIFLVHHCRTLFPEMFTFSKYENVNSFCSVISLEYFLGVVLSNNLLEESAFVINLQTII